MKDKEFIKEALDLFALSNEVWKDNREAAKDDIKFALLSEQWDEADRENRRKRGKPCLTINKLPTHIRQVVNDARQNKPRIKINPVDDYSDPETAEVLTGLIRNIENSSKSDLAYDTAITQSVSSSFGFIRVNIDYAYDDTFDKDIVIDRITNQFSVYPDPYSMSADGSDWMCCFVTERITKDEFKRRYGNKKQSDFNADDYSSLEAPWSDDGGILIAEYWKREEVPKTICLLNDGQVINEDVYNEDLDLFIAQGLQKVESRETKTYEVTQYIISGAEVLEENEWPGRYIPIVPCYGEEVIEEDKRYFKSLVRDSKDPQRQFNFWRTLATEHAGKSTKTPWIGKKGTFATDANKWATANVIDHAHIEYDGQEPPFQPPPFPPHAAALQEAMNSADDIQATMGMFDASIGQRSNETSGKAIIARQHESDTGSFHFVDNLSRTIRHVGCIIIDLIPHVYSGDRVIRVLGEDMKETKNVRIGQGGETEDGARIYDLTTGKYDVVVSAGASYSTQRQESASQMIEMMRVNPQAGQLMMDLLAKNLDWPGAEEISERFKAMLPPQITGENPQIQQLQQQLQMMQQQAEQMMSQLQKQVEDLKADKTIDAYKAETDRLKVVSTTMTPEQMQMMIIQTVQNLMQTPDITPLDNMQESVQYPQQQPPMEQMTNG